MSTQEAYTAAEPPVEVYLVAGQAYVWSASSIALLRRNHGIIGMLTGSLPLIPQQNAFLGVPLQLFEEEVVYLMRKQAIVLVDDVKAHDVQGLTATGLQKWHQQRAEYMQDRRRAALEELKESKESLKKQFASSKSAKEKKRERQERKMDETKAANDDASLFRPNPPPENSEEGIKNVSHPITIPSSSSGLPWHTAVVGENAYDRLSSAAEAGVWRYPETAEQRAKCATFEALKEKGYFMGKGLRFGGDFVVYPGDPLRYHSHFTATVQATPESLVSAHELIAAGRLGTAVKKAHLLCSVRAVKEEQVVAAWQRRLSGKDDSINQKWGEVDFISLTWAGFGV